MREIKQGIRSTTKTAATPATPTPADPTPSESRTRTHTVFLKQIEVTGRLSTNQTGRFPTTSSLGSKYLMIAHDRDSNKIPAHFLKNRSKQELKNAYKIIFEYLTKRDLRPMFQVMSNECSQSLKDHTTE